MSDQQEPNSTTQTAGRGAAGTSPSPSSPEKPAIAAARAQADAVGQPALGIDSGSMSGVVNAPHIDGYEFVRELHRGGQGVVYQALEKATKRKVAIKILLDGQYASESARKRFEREIELAASLKHPNIVAVFHSGLTQDGRQFCVMDYVRGAPLHKYVRDQKLPLEDVLKLFAKVCDAVHYAHQKGVIHRDLKPGNILVDTEGSPKVLDFGLARQVGGPEQTILSMTGQVVGTLQYMSPEQTRGNPDEIDIRTDVYSLGVILYELLTGKFPYPVAGQMIDVVRHIVSTEPTPPSRTWNADSGITQKSSMRKSRVACPIDDEIQTIMMRALTKERQRRYQTAADLGADIEHYLKNEPIEAKRDSTLYVLKKRIGRNKARVIAVVGTLVGIAAITGAVFMRRAYRAQRSEDLVVQAQPLVNEEQYAEAEPKLLEALKYDPDNFAAVMNLATVKRFESEAKKDNSIFDQALDLLDRASQLEPNRAEPYNVKGIFLRNAGRLDDAIAVLNRGILTEPGYSSTYITLANALVLKNDWLGAESKLKAVDSLPIQEQDPRPWQRWHNLALVQLVLNRPEAIEAVKKALAHEGKKSPHVNLVEARVKLWLKEAFDPAAALEAAIVAGRSDGVDVSRAKQLRALAELRMKNWAGAAAAAKEALKASQSTPPPAQANLIAAIALANAGSMAEARAHLDAAIHDKPAELESLPLGVKPYVDSGLIWFESFAEYDTLRKEAEKLLSTAGSPASAPAAPPEKTGS